MTKSGSGAPAGWVDSEDYVYSVEPLPGSRPVLLDLLAYWERKRGDRIMPTRADIDPLELKGHLGWLILVDVLPGLEDFRYRLVGTNIVHAVGRDSTGRTVRELYANTAAGYVSMTLKLFRLVAEEAQAVWTGGTLRVLGRGHRQFQTLMLPLDTGDGAVGKILVEQRFF